VIKAEASMARLMGEYGVLPIELAEIQRFVNDAHRQIDQIRRRVIEGESIAHEEKVFSLLSSDERSIHLLKLGKLR